MISQHSATKPFLKWAGGKSKLLAQIEQVIDKSPYKNSITTYVEPFVGGGAVLFFMLRKFPNIERAIINDINEELINTYRVVQQYPTDLIEYLTKLQLEYRNLTDHGDKRKFYEERRSEFNAGIDDNVARAAVVIFLNRTCFNGLYRVNKKGKFNVPFGRYKNPLICDRDTIMADSVALKNVEILCGDFTQTLPYANSDSLFYFDPPYKPISDTSSFTAYSLVGFGDADQLRLKKFCDDIFALGAKFILSNSDVYAANKDCFFDNLYKSYQIDRVKVGRAINAQSFGRSKVNELLINNLDYEKTHLNYSPAI